MRVIIPTAGEGKRLRPFTHTLPKVLLQVADKPILGHILDKLVAEGLTDVTFVIGYMGEKISHYVHSEYPMLNARFVEQEEVGASNGNVPYGLGYAISLTRDPEADPDEPILMILGDTVIQADLTNLLSADTTMIGVQEVPDPKRFGIVEIEGDVITGMVEKPEEPKTNLAVVGIYYIKEPGILYDCLEANIHAGILTKGEVQLTDALQGMLHAGVTMKAFKVDGWFDCGKPETLLSTNRVLLEQRFMNNLDDLVRRFPSVHFKPPVWIDPTAVLDHSIVGPHVTVGQGGSLSSSIVRNTIINAGAEVHNALLSGSIIGNESIVSGTALRLYVGDKSEIKFD